MLKLMRDCAPWLNWKIGAAFAAGLAIGFMAVSVEAGLPALIGATPLLAILLCLVPCAIPLLFLRRRGAQRAAPSAHTADPPPARQR